MVQGVFQFMIMSAKFGVIMALILAFISLLNFLVSYLLIGYDNDFLTEVIALVQLWLPFNINVIFVWAVMGTTLYFGVKFARFAINFLNDFVR